MCTHPVTKTRLHLTSLSYHSSLLAYSQAVSQEFHFDVIGLPNSAGADRAVSTTQELFELRVGAG